jgi:DNA polymerase III epsilon subunit family exonuclease
MTQDISTLDFVAFDTETTGLRPSSEGLVEIAAVRFNLLTGAQEYFQTSVNPGRPIPWAATRVHGITDEMVFEAPPVEKVLPSFFRFLGDAIPVAHNAPFDIGFISLHGLRAGLEPPGNPVLDSCMFSRRVCTQFASHRLEALVKEFAIGESTFHRALADAKSCMEVFRKVVSLSCGMNASWEALVARHGRLHSFVDGSRSLAPSPKAPPGLEPLLSALEQKRRLWILYDGNFSPREVTPLLLYARGQQQYMEATCHLDGVRKSFRLDRIQKVYTSHREGKPE